ncbi:MAG: hypothetical protein HEQ39_13535 [Rhizobacter sp.]
MAEAPTNTNKQPVVVPPKETAEQPPTKKPTIDELRAAANPVFQELASSVGLKVPAPTNAQEQVDLATKIWVKLKNNADVAQKSGDADAIKAALDAKANFIGALVKAGGGQLNFGIPGVTSSGETPVSVKPPVVSTSQSPVPAVDPSVQKNATAVLGEVKEFKVALEKLKPEEVPQKADAIEQRATELLAKLKPLDQQLSAAEKNSPAMSDAAAAVKVAIDNLEGYIKQIQEMKKSPPTTTPQTGNVDKPDGSSLTPTEVKEFRERGMPAAKAANDEANALLKEISELKKTPTREEAKALEGRISAILQKLTDSAKQVAPFAKQDPASFGTVQKILEQKIDTLTKMLGMLQGGQKQPGNVDKPVDASATSTEVEEFKKTGVPAAVSALDEANAFMRTVKAPKTAEEAKSLLGRISEILPKLTESAKQIAPFAKSDRTTFGKLEAGLKEQIDGLTKMKDMLQKAIDKAK